MSAQNQGWWDAEDELDLAMREYCSTHWRDTGHRCAVMECACGEIHAYCDTCQRFLNPGGQAGHGHP